MIKSFFFDIGKDMGRPPQIFCLLTTTLQLSCKTLLVIISALIYYRSDGFLFLPFSLFSLSFNEQAVTISGSLQMDVVNAFQTGTSFQGALRRQPSIASQHHDVTNVSTPTHVVFTAATTASTTVGCELVS